MPLKHKHRITRPEAPTTPCSTIHGGGNLVDVFTVGSGQLVSHGNVQTTSNLLARPNNLDDGQLTYPLHGENVLDWRNPKKTHNNIPPSLNVIIKYKESTGPRGIPSTISDGTSIQSEPMRFMRATINSSTSIVEAQYESQMVNGL